MKHNYLFRGLLLVFALFLSFASYGQAQRSGAMDLTAGENRHVNLVYQKDHIESDNGQEFTFETWIKIKSDGNSGNDYTIFRARGGDNGDKLALVWKGTYFRLDALGTTWSWDNVSSIPSMADTWRHVAFRYDGNYNVKIYIDGTLRINSNLLKNGSYINHLVEEKDKTDGTYFRIGGEAVDDGTKGLAWVAEARLWKKALDYSTIKAYYDEEINSSHPNWSNLLTYHHMTRSYSATWGSGTRNRVDDVKNYYDAVVDDNSAYVVSSQYPPIKPPRFNGFSVNLSADTCEPSDKIDVNWSNFARSTSYRDGLNTSNNRVYPDYELLRKASDGSTSVVKESSSINYDDTNVSSGDKYQYRIRTYWVINGTKYYSDDSDWSNWGSVRSRYDAPTLTVTTDRCDGKIALSWSSSATPPNWTIKRSTASNMSGAVTLATKGGSTTSYTDNSANIETNYYYTVTASGTDSNNCTVSGTASSAENGFTSQAPSAPTNFTLTQDIPNRALNLSWSNRNNNNHDAILIKRTKFGTSDEKIIELASSATNYNDTDVELCTSYTYAIASKNECASDGIYALSEVTGNVSQDLSNVMASLEVSKGYYGDRVRLMWEINGGLTQIDRFKILRSKADESNFELLDIVDNNLIYDDKTAVGGVFYKYLIVGESQCEDLTIQSNSLTELGFTMPFGVANGHIEYAGGNAVKDVKVRFEPQNGLKGKSLKFDGDGDYVAIKNMKYQGTNYKEVTVEAWVKTTATSNQIIASFDRSEYWRLEMLSSGKVGWSVSVAGGMSVIDFTGNKVINDGIWHHVAGVYDNGKIRIFVDGELDNERTGGNGIGSGATRYGFIGAGSEASGYGAAGTSPYFNGNIDEVRIWNVAQSEEQIANNYARILNSSETGLMAYWRMDEGVGSNIFDASKTGVDFNKNDAVFFGDVDFSTDTPSEEQLGIMATTNEFGNYSVSYIPYSGGGEIFNVTPSLGQHEFEPNSRTVYVGDGATTQNNLDFTDISFFTVQGKVAYQNCVVPVEGVSILIDGEQALGDDNKPVRTDTEGNYTINVPIGNHFLTAEKEGHVFAEGQFPPLDEYGSVTFHEFIEDLTVNFIDSTKVTVAGRIVGGNREGQKVLGFGKSVNNIGVADLQLKLQKEGYDLDTTSAEIYNTVSLTTDPYSGEFTMKLIPEQFIVNKAGNEKYLLEPSDLSVVDLRNSLTPVSVTDSTEKIINSIPTQVVDTFVYHHSLVYTIKTTPDILLSSDQEGNPLIGDQELYFINQSTNEDDTLDISALNLPFSVFQMGKTYQSYIRVVETYENPSHPDYPDGGLVDNVPVEGAEISIINNLMMNSVGITATTNSEGYVNHTFKAGQPNISQNGDLSYTKTLEINADVEGLNVAYQGGQPYRAYVLGGRGLEGTGFVTAGPEVPEIILRDPPGSNSYAYIERGSSFKATKSWGYGLNSNSSLDYNSVSGAKISIGGGVAGPAFESELINETKYGIKLTKDYDYSGNYTESYSFNQRIETSSDPEDVGSDADLYIGKGMNYYITQSKNLRILERQYCIEHGLEFYDDGSNSTHVLGIIDGVMVDGESETFFVYSQKHILYELIPNLIALRDNQFLKDEYESNYLPSSPYFGLSNDHDNLPENAVSYTFTPSYESQVDSVELLNQQIGIWLGYIETNEMEKHKATVVENLSIDGSSGQYQNSITEKRTGSYSYENVATFKVFSTSELGFLYAGAGFTMESHFDVALDLSQGEDSETANTLEFGYVIDEDDEGDYYSIDVKKENGTVYASPDEFASNVISRKDWVENQAINSSIAGGIGGAKMLTGYGLGKFIGKISGQVAARRQAALNAGLFAVDLALHVVEMSSYAINRGQVHNKADGVNVGEVKVSGFSISSPIFSVRGGQSRCPYEGGETSMLYIDENTQKLVELQTATLRREVPKISVEQAEISNVPESEDAEFTLYLQNESESNSNMWYDLDVLENTNPDGAVLMIDGAEIYRSFLVPAGETLTKTLTLGKGKADVLEYDSIGIILKSTCQYNPMDLTEDIADTVYITARFLPECSDITLNGLNENWVANYEDNDEVAVSLSGYNLNLSTLESIDFQYKSLSGSPITVKKYFKEDNAAYQTYSGEKELLADRSSVNLLWDLSALTDRQYQVRARAHCIDGSITETEYLTGTIDRITPKPFGTPNPADGILSPGEDISIRFNETIEAGLVKDHNITLKAVLNGADIAHGTSVQLDGANDYITIQGVSLNNKSFTFEFWMQREPGSTGTIFSKGVGDEAIALRMITGGQLELQLGTQTFNADPTGAYNSTYPEESWHHWAFAYDQEADLMQLYIDDQQIFSINDQEFNSSDIETVFFGQDASSGNNMAMNLHEVRIWEESRALGEVVANMNATLSGRELALYGYWPMDEGKGDLARDYAAGRNMNLNGNWLLRPEGHAFAFDGTQFLTLDGRNVVIGPQTDMTLEFWFKADQPADSVTLFSQGRGESRELASDSSLSMSITAAPDGNIFVKSKGHIFKATSANYCDNNWHHFAFSLGRRSNAKSYIDGVLQKQSVAANFGGLAGTNLWIGARGRRTVTTPEMDQYFKGEIDDVRIWISRRSAEHIKLYMNHKLNGDEEGLVAYYPFEAYTNVMGAIVLENSLSDQLRSDIWTNDLLATTLNGETFSTSLPAIKDIRPLQDIPFTYVVNDDELLIQPTIDATRIEGQVLEITVKDIQDLYGNRMLSPASWTAFMEQNQVVWQENSINLESFEGEMISFTVNVANLGGIPYEFNLENIPSWLNVSQEFGTVQPNSELPLTFTAINGLNIGSYTQNINLSTALGFDEKLSVNLRVKAQEPNWAVNPSDYQLTMNVFGRLIIEEVPSADELDIVAAFVNGECRGKSYVEYYPEMDAYLVTLNIFSNVTSGETIELKAWDASKGRIYENVTPELSFVPNNIVGTVTSPIAIETDNTIRQEIQLPAGWSWISVNLESDDLTTIDAFLNGIGAEGDIIKDQSNFDQYSEGTGWIGSLTNNGGISPTNMYKVQLTNPSTIILKGAPVDTRSTTISIASGWNYIGYLPQQNMSLNEALARMNPQDDDLIKNASSFAMYSNTLGWIGSLKSLKPGEGYMLYSNTATDLIYPKQSSASASRYQQAVEQPVNLPEEYITEYSQFSNTMALVARLEEVNPEEDEVLLAFADNEPRGFAKPVSLPTGETLYLLSVSGNNLPEDINFRLFNTQSGRLTYIKEKYKFQGDSIEGTLKEPVSLHLQQENTSFEELLAYPNPTQDMLKVVFNGTPDATYELQIVNMAGRQLIIQKVKANAQGGLLSDLDLSKLDRGVYILLLTGEMHRLEKLIIRQ